jgi:succinoglycan biosynthesis transport protein ExoP
VTDHAPPRIRLTGPRGPRGTIGLRGPSDPTGPSQMSHDPDLIRLGAIFAGIGRGWWIVALSLAACATLAWHYAYTVATPTYRAVSSIVMETGERAFIDFDETTGRLSREAASLNTEIGVLQGIDLMGRVVDDLGLARDPEFNPALRDPSAAAQDARIARDAAVRGLLAAIAVRNLPESLIFEIAVTTSDPAKSMRIANAIADVYIAEQVERKIAETQRAADWLRNRVSELQAELLQAETEVEDYRFGLDGASTDEIVEREQLVAEAEAIRTLYRYLLTRLQETVAQEGLQRPDARVLSSAMLPLSPAAPRRKAILGAGAAAGLLLGLLLVFVRESTRSGIRSSRAVERATGIEVMGELPRIPFAIGRSPLSGPPGPRAAHFIEAVETLLTTLLISRVGTAPHVFVVVSPHSGDGKTSVVIQMARQFAERGHRTLIVDADTRKRTLSLHVGAAAPGLTGLLTGEATLADAVGHSAALGCDILGNPGRVAASGATHEAGGICRLMEAARQHYDIVLIDTPPLNAVADALPYAVDADSVLMVSRWNRTTEADLATSLRMLAQVDTSPAGLVVTRIKPSLLGQAGYASYFRRS